VWVIFHGDRMRMVMTTEESSPLRSLLSRVECFAALDEASLQLLEQRMRTEHFPTGKVVCREGDDAEWMFIVAEGELAVMKQAEGGPVQVASLGEGDFGGMMSLFESQPRSATLIARADTTLWVLDHDTFTRLLEANADLSRHMLRFMSKRLRRDTGDLAATLSYVAVSGLEDLYQECSPEERLILDTINRKVAAAESLSSLIDFLFDSLRRISPTSRVALAFVEEQAHRVVAHYSRADYEPMLLRPGYAEDLTGSSLAKVIESGQPRVINDLQEYLAAHPRSSSTALVVREGLRSSMTCPLSVGGRNVGLLFRSSTEPHAYDAHQVRLQQAIAESLSQAVEKAYRIEQLTEANRAYTEMLGFVSHELKNPVASMVMDAKLLAQGFLGDLTEQQKQKVERSIVKGEYLLALVREYLDLARIESGALQANFTEDVDFVSAVVDPAIDIMDPQREEKGMTITKHLPNGAPRVTCDVDLLKIVMTNLVGNAVKYGSECGEVRITVRHVPTQFRVSVWNEGPGFSEAEKHKLFRKFSRLDSPELRKQKGTGVGLYSCWQIAQLHGGHIRARSLEGQWAEFYFYVPQPPPNRQAAR
jgi:signal transduction histidine kinase